MDKKVMDFRQMNWVAVFEAQASSGLSKRDFCKQSGIPESAFFRWQRNLRKQLLKEPEAEDTISAPAEMSAPVADKPSFFEITPSHTTALSEDNAISSLEYDYPPEVKIPPSVSISYEKFSIKLSGSLSPAALTAVLKAVKDA